MTFNSSYCSCHPTWWNSTEHSKPSQRITQGMRGSSMGILLKATPRFFSPFTTKGEIRPPSPCPSWGPWYPRHRHSTRPLCACLTPHHKSTGEHRSISERASDVKRPPVTLVEWLSMLRDISSGDSDRNATTVMVSWFQDSDEADLNFPPMGRRNWTGWWRGWCCWSRWFLE